MTKKESQKIIRMLIGGSRAIDGMRQEINCVVRTVLGLANSSCDWKEGRRSEIKLHSSLSRPEEFFWEVLATENCKLKVSFVLHPNSPSLANSVIYYCYAGNVISTGIHMEYVKMIYDSLGVFIDLMTNNFPFLIQKWQPLLDAAKLAEK